MTPVYGITKPASKQQKQWCTEEIARTQNTATEHRPISAK